MSVGALVGTVVAILACAAAVLIGLTYLSARRNKPAPLLPFYAGGVGVFVVIASLVGHSDLVSHLNHLVRAGLDVAPWLGASFCFFTILDALIIANG